MNKKVFMGVCTAVVCTLMAMLTAFIITEESRGGLGEEPLTADEIADEKSDRIVVRKSGEGEDPMYKALDRSELDLGSAEKIMVPVSDVKTYNNELQIYLSDQIGYSGMNIRICAEKIGVNYISGKMESRMAFRYGDFSFRVGTVEGKGLFPAIWMIPQNMDLLPETDLFEMIGNEPDRFYGVLHYYEDGKRRTAEHIHHFGPYAPSDFVLTFEWREDHMTWKVDGAEVFRITEHVPDVPVFMIMNLAVGGDWPGSPDEDTDFPADFNVEILEFQPEEMYVRD